METLLEIVEKSEEYCEELRQLKEKFIEELGEKLDGRKPAISRVSDSNSLDELPNVTPQQTKKRIKRLSLLNETDEIPLVPIRASNSQLLATAVAMELAPTDDEFIPQTPTVNLTAVPLGVQVNNVVTTEEALMPPPPVPVMAAQSDLSCISANETFARPQRAAKLKSEKKLKEPQLKHKMRRPSTFDTTKVKLEQEQRPSQIDAADVNSLDGGSSKSDSSIRSEDSVVALQPKSPSILEIKSDDEQTTKDVQRESCQLRELRIKVKREKRSIGSDQEHLSQGAVSSLPSSVVEEPLNSQQTEPLPKVCIKSELRKNDSTLGSTALSVATTSSAANTKRRKKKDVLPKPIKVERFSDAPILVAARKRRGRRQARISGGSVYEDAVDQPLETEFTNTPPTGASALPPEIAATVGIQETGNMPTQPDKIGNATVVIGLGATDATFCANTVHTTFQVDVVHDTFVMDNQNANMTVTIDKKSGMGGSSGSDTTYNVPGSGADKSTASSQHSMETAKDSIHPQDSLITEDESFEPEKPKSKLPNLPKSGQSSAKLTTAKTFKMPSRTNELFNPLVQSPVKKKVEAFENAVIAAQNTELTKSGRPKRTKENAVSSSVTTPIISKLASVPALGRFLTPTQTSNITPSALSNVKKAPNSASKIMTFPRAITTVKACNSATATKTLSRDNSAEDFRKGLHSLAEERKKQREQKHLLAAQQREVKERERAERAAKLNKEREEKRLKKLQEAEQKKRALDEIQRNLRQQEEAARLKAVKAKAIAEQERELLLQMKTTNTRSAAAKMLPPPPKHQSKYTFEMLHEDDSTDEEEKPSHNRPPPPTWSRSHVRGAAIRVQQYWPTKIIDSFFSVQPMSPDLRLIFPNIGSQHLKRNSSVLWSTPPRYSELPKY